MKRMIWCTCVILSGCFGDAPPAMMPDGGDPRAGGTITPAGCGYTVTVRDGASAPAPSAKRLGSDPTPVMIHLGLATDPARSMVVTWRTRDEATQATTVQFGTGGGTGESADGFWFDYDSPTAPTARIHETHLCGLTPDTVYSYRVGGVGGDGSEKWSPVYTFRTAPDFVAHPDAQVTLAVIGDTRDGYATWGQSLAQAQKLGPPDLVLFSGDAVTLGPIQTEWDEFWTQAEPVLRTVPMISAHGNHDVNSINYYSQLALPGDEEDYSLDYGAVHITVLNDTPVSMGDLAGKAAQFLDADLAAHDAAPWKAVLHHRPMWSAAAAHGGDPALRMLWQPIVDAHKVDVVFNGHDHDYERTKPMRGMTPGATPADGTIYVVAGTAGAPLYDSGSDFWTAISSKTHNLVIVHARVGMLDAHAYDENGNSVDQFTIGK